MLPFSCPFGATEQRKRQHTPAQSEGRKSASSMVVGDSRRASSVSRALDVRQYGTAQTQSRQKNGAFKSIEDSREAARDGRVRRGDMPPSTTYSVPVMDAARVSGVLECFEPSR
jgi:hypothetical protein